MSLHNNVNINEHSNKKLKLELSDSQEDSSFDCPICCEKWDSRGDHRLISLKCGHLFGKKCIERWIYNKTKKSGSNKATCPVCSKTLYEKNICIVKPAWVAVKDTAQSESLKRELESLRGQIKMVEKDVDLAQLALNLHKKELERAKERKLSGITLTSAHKKVEDIPHNTVTSYSIVISKKISEKRHTTRVMCLDQLFNKAYISFKSSENTHDILKLDLANSNQSDSIAAHNGLIRDIQHSNNDDNLILSTSTDKTLKLTSGKTNRVEHTMSLPLPGWTCSFDNTDPTKIYCGLGNSNILIYDIRNPNQILQNLESINIQKSPLHSMFVNQLGIFCSNLSQSFVWDMSKGDNECNILNVDTKDFKPYSMSYVEGGENTVLLSSRSQNTTKHQLISVDKNYNTTVESSFDSPHAQKSLTRTFSYLPDSNHSLQDAIVCYSDESNGMLRVVKSKKELQYFKIHSCPLDIKPHSAKKIAFLTDNRFFLLEPKYNLVK